MQMLPTRQELALLKAIEDRVHDLSCSPATLQSLLQASKGANPLSTVPMKMDLTSGRLINNRSGVMISPLELMLATGDCDDIAAFLNTINVPLDDVVLANLQGLSFENVNHVSLEGRNVCAARLSKFLRETNIASALDVVGAVLLGASRRQVDQQDPTDHKNMWEALKAKGLAIGPNHMHLVHETILDYLRNINHKSTPYGALEVLANAPDNWFGLSHAFYKGLGKTLLNFKKWKAGSQEEEQVDLFVSQISLRSLGGQVRNRGQPKKMSKKM